MSQLMNIFLVPITWYYGANLIRLQFLLVKSFMPPLERNQCYVWKGQIPISPCLGLCLVASTIQIQLRHYPPSFTVSLVFN